MALFTWRPRRPRTLTGRGSTRYARDVVMPTRHVEHEFRALWRDVAQGCGFARTTVVAAGVTISPPRIGGVRIGPDGTVSSATVQRHPGQRVADYRTAAALLADALGCARLQVDDLGTERWMRLTLLDVDPLAEVAHWDPLHSADVIVGTETGGVFSCPWPARPHLVVQGSTGAGKSAFAYSQLAPLAAERGVRVVGIDPSSLLFRPWPDDPWRVSGLSGDLVEHRRALRALCAEMDRRLTALPEGTDNLVTSPDVPLLACVLEELPALFRAADLIDRKVGHEVRGLVGRIAAEGRKVGLRLFLILQRADTSILDGAVRGQATLRVSFSTDPDGIAMLHPRGSIDPDEHAIAEPGVCAVTAPRVGTFRGRALFVDYGQYCAAVRAGFQS